MQSKFSPVATYIVATIHTCIFLPGTIHAGTLGTYCRSNCILSPAIIYADIDTFSPGNGATIYALNYDTSCRRQKNMQSTLKQIVAETLLRNKEPHVRYCQC